MPSKNLSVVYHGVVSKERIPPTVISAIASVPGATLTIIGYETVGSVGYADQLVELSRELAIDDRIDFMGPLPRAELLREGLRHDVGLVWVPRRSQYINLATAVGSSQKVFDYLACGLALIVPNTSEWEEFIVAPGYGLSSDFLDVSQLTAALTYLRDDRELTGRLGAAGRKRVLEDWNFETQFAPVFDILNSNTETSPE
jgi:glycosyltransferase involved in cell wall biosynthesis